ncbi:hypothetical protein [Breznakiella homolactica]|uniref:PEGA domain-containing protein n=1 Tax=Breznakiella homolactica TaxID=2798577 RepID=A0A7T8B9F7_9SPIR|nr:hypothetical protein [Breznakiella homolactica]QQO08286.1 hypothetical protein JFL75_15285 [Breznakiella homolactica]
MAAVLMLCFCIPLCVFPRGTADDEGTAALNGEWVLCITAINTEALSPSQRIIGNLVSRTLVKDLRDLDHRVRPADEYGFYKDYAWNAAHTEAAQALVKKRQERDNLLFMGEKNWQYRQNLKKLEQEITQLEEALLEAEHTFPLIEKIPSFVLTEGNLSGNYPAPPEPGREYGFCRDQKADGFLAAEVSEFHGRIYVTLRIYALYAQEYIYEDYALFSAEDQDAALMDLSGRMTAMVSGTVPASIRVFAEPENSVIVINDSFAGRGSTGAMDQFPGETSVQAFAPNYESAFAEVNMDPGEIVELHFKLTPLMMEAFGIEIAEGERASVYRGALYIGDTPMVLDVPRDRFEYVMVETPDGKTTSVVFRGQTASTVLHPMDPNIPENKSVETLRRKFYGAFARFWIALPVAILFNGIASARINGYNQASANGTATDSLYRDANIYYYTSIGGWVVAGTFLTEALVRFFFYTRAANSGISEIVE